MIQKPDFGSKANSIYGEAHDALGESNLHYMLGGAVALNAYMGIWRDTKDLDVFVPGKSVPQVLETLEAAGLAPKVGVGY